MMHQELRTLPIRMSPMSETEGKEFKQPCYQGKAQLIWWELKFTTVRIKWKVVQIVFNSLPTLYNDQNFKMLYENSKLVNFLR